MRRLHISYESLAIQRTARRALRLLAVLEVTHGASLQQQPLERDDVDLDGGDVLRAVDAALAGTALAEHSVVSGKRTMKSGGEGARQNMSDITGITHKEKFRNDRTA